MYEIVSYNCDWTLRFSSYAEAFTAAVRLYYDRVIGHFEIRRI